MAHDVDRDLMRWALREAERAEREGEVPVGAVVSFGGQVVVAARNDRERTRDPTGHAELRAIIRASQTLERWRLTGCTLYVTLEPCIMCAGAAVQARLDRIVFGAKDPKGGAAGSLYEIPTDPRLNHRIEVQGGVLAEDCGALLREFFLRRRR